MSVDRLSSRIFLQLLIGCASTLLILQFIISQRFLPSTPPAPSLTERTTQPNIVGGLGGINVATIAVPCAGKAETPKAMFQKLFKITDYQRILTSKYQETQDKLLCADKYPWRSSVSLPWSQVVKTLDWPSDLIQESMKNQVISLFPLSQVDPATEKIQQEKANSNQPAPGCEVGIANTWIKINICDFVEKVIKAAIVDPIMSVFDNVVNQANHFLWDTPAEYTYDLNKNESLKYFNWLSLALVNVYLLVVVAWVGLRHTVSSTFSWLSYAELQESLPRLAWGIILANLSMPLAATIIESSNVLAHLFHGHILTSMLDTKIEGLAGIVIQALYALMGILFVLEAAARYSILYVVLAFLPLLLFAASMKETAHIASATLKGFILITFLQPAQLAVMDVGQLVITTMIKTGDTGNLLKYLMGIGIMVLSLWLFFVFTGSAFGGMFGGASTALFGTQLAALAWGGGKVKKALVGNKQSASADQPERKEKAPLSPRSIGGFPLSPPPIATSAISGLPIKSLPPFSASRLSGTQQQQNTIVSATRFAGGTRIYSGTAAQTIQHMSARQLSSPTHTRSSASRSPSSKKKGGEK